LGGLNKCYKLINVSYLLKSNLRRQKQKNVKRISWVIYLHLPANLAETPPNQLNKTKYKNPLQYRAVQIHKKEQKVIKKDKKMCDSERGRKSRKFYNKIKH
jgi:hypothetical protein